MAGRFRGTIVLDRVSLIRHVALCAAALTAYFARQELRVGNSVLWIVALAAVLNLQVALFSGRPRLGTIARRLSPLLGLGGWLGLMHLTGGVRSPFIAGLWLEIILSALTTSLPGIALVTAATVAGLWTEQGILGTEGLLLPLALQTGFLLATGGVTAFLAQRSRQSQNELADRLAALQQRLGALEKELDQSRALGALGQGVARLAHGYKNTVHSLRGFAKLIETRLAESKESHKLTEGLRTAIDRLEEMAHTTLGPPGASGEGALRSHGTATVSTVEEVAREMAAAFPLIKWSLALGPNPPAVSVPLPVIREIVTIVVRNAAEAVSGEGEVAIETVPTGRTLEIRVRDSGPGVPESSRERIFEPGFTTKPDGHGLGLYLARRLLESSGGLLRLETATGGATLFSIQLPVPGTWSER